MVNSIKCNNSCSSSDSKWFSTFKFRGEKTEPKQFTATTTNSNHDNNNNNNNNSNNWKQVTHHNHL